MHEGALLRNACISVSGRAGKIPNRQRGVLAIHTLYIDPKVQKRITRLTANASARYEYNAARKASRIIHQLTLGVLPYKAGRLSDNGEARIKNCFKFDLGKGYRLVCVKSQRRFFVLFMGHHDSCDTWLYNNSGLNPDTLQVDFLIQKVKIRVEPSNSVSENLLDSIDSDDDLMTTFSQKDLRSLFSGLAGNR